MQLINNCDIVQFLDQYTLTACMVGDFKINISCNIYKQFSQEKAEECL